jgi:hypothetical protein
MSVRVKPAGIPSVAGKAKNLTAAAADIKTPEILKADEIICVIEQHAY